MASTDLGARLANCISAAIVSIDPVVRRLTVEEATRWRQPDRRCLIRRQSVISAHWQTTVVVHRCGSILRPARDADIIAKATQAIPVVSVLVRANVRSTGDPGSQTRSWMRSFSTAAWLVSNPTQLPHDL